MTDQPRRINYDKTPPPAADTRPPLSYVTDPEMNPYAFQEYPMPLIYSSDDDDAQFPNDYRAEHDAEYDRVSRSFSGGLSAKVYVWTFIAVMSVLVGFVLLANLVAD